MVKKVFVLTLQSAHVKGSNHLQTKCAKCNISLKLGDKILTNTRRKNKTKLYHLTCWENMHIDTEEATA